IFMSTILVLIVPLRMHEAVFKKKPQSFLDFSKQYFWPLFLEQLRVLGSILLRTLLFIIPGIHRMFRLSMVPYVVYFSSAYKADKVDALEYSNNVVKGYTFFVFVVSIMEYLTIYGLENLLEKQGQLSHIEITLFTQSTGVLVSTYSYCLLLMLYLLRIKGVDRTE
ncbi:MAG: hypothetical protein KDD50_07985, partial [Bdellovibrionales bacterium]|nr:hypothetical protein [Bdellovibrionales bacterium]